jgi:hypothetical protein
MQSVNMQAMRCCASPVKRQQQALPIVTCRVWRTSCCCKGLVLRNSTHTQRPGSTKYKVTATNIDIHQTVFASLPPCSACALLQCRGGRANSRFWHMRPASHG